MNNIIAFAGLKNAGKDSSADMLIYMLNTPKFMHSYTMYKLLGVVKGKWKKTSFAKPLKQVLSIMLNIPVEKFEDREFKERCYINFNTLELKFECELKQEDKLSDNQFNKLIKTECYEKIINSWISIRQVMQYVGTQVLRKFISDDVWINATITKDIVISDLRFKREFDTIKQKNGLLIYVNRPGCVPGNHASEREVYELYQQNKFEYILENNGDLKDLFYKIKDGISKTICS